MSVRRYRKKSKWSVLGQSAGGRGTVYMLAAEADLLKEWLVDVDQGKPEETSYSWLT
jgi:hypothetical protein